MKYTVWCAALTFALATACNGDSNSKNDSGVPIDTSSGGDTATTSDTGDSDSTDSDADAGGNDTDSESDADSGPSDECAALPFQVNVSPINLIIMLDRSRSMIINQDSGQTFRDIAKASIKKIVTTYDDSDLINFGLTAFPSASLCKCDDEDPEHWEDQYCTTEEHECTPGGTPSSGFTPPLVPVGPNNSADITAQLDAIGTCGGTPICPTLEWVSSYAASLSPELGALPTHVLLVTDGVPNCNSEADTSTCECTQEALPGACGAPTLCLDDACANAAAKKLFETDGHSVFVLGVGENLENTWGSVLNAIASNGGTNQYYSAANATAFEAAIDNITSSAVECSYEIPWGDIPSSTDSGSVSKGCDKVRVYGIADKDKPNERDPIAYSHDCSDPKGWRWKEIDEDLGADDGGPSPSTDQCKTVVLCEDTCDSLKKGKVDQVSFGFGCGILVVVK